MDLEELKKIIQDTYKFATNPPQKGPFGVLPSPFSDTELAQAEKNREGVMLGEINPKWGAKMNLYRQIEKEVADARGEADRGRRAAHERKYYSKDFDKVDALENTFRKLDNELRGKTGEAAELVVKPVGKERVPPPGAFIDENGNPIMGVHERMNPMQKKSFEQNLAGEVRGTPTQWPDTRNDSIRVFLQQLAEQKAREGK